MKIGACSQIDNVKYVKEFGYDFFEGPFWNIATLSDEEFSDYYKEYERVGLPAYSFNGFFGGDVKLYTENAIEAIRSTVEKGFERAASLEGRNVVIGSGRARSIPDGADIGFVRKRFVDILAFCGDIAAKYGMTVTVEPLNSNETNFINTVGEGAELARLSGRDNVGVLVDFFHFTCENESDTALLPVADILYHVHIATPRPSRGIPEEEDIPTVKKWAKMLSDIGYKGLISLECNHDDDIAESYRRAKEILDIFK